MTFLNLEEHLDKRGNQLTGKNHIKCWQQNEILWGIGRMGSTEKRKCFDIETEKYNKTIKKPALIDFYWQENFLYETANGQFKFMLLPTV